MLRRILVMLLLGSCPLAGAQVSPYADVRAAKGVQLGAQELRRRHAERGSACERVRIFEIIVATEIDDDD